MPRDASHGIKLDSGSLVNTQSTTPSDSNAFRGQYQHVYAPQANAFSSQLELPLAQGSGRQGPYDMGAMASALSPPGSRLGYGTGQHQQRYTPAGPGIIPQMVHFPGQPHMPQLTNQTYYFPQNQQMPPYFTTQMSPSTQHQQQHQFGSLRGTGMQYYTMATQSQMPGYYYPNPGQYSSQASPTHGPLAQSQYYLPDGPSGDPKTSPLQSNNNVDGSGGYRPGEGMN